MTAYVFRDMEAKQQVEVDNDRAVVENKKEKIRAA